MESRKKRNDRALQVHESRNDFYKGLFGNKHIHWIFVLLMFVFITGYFSAIAYGGKVPQAGDNLAYKGASKAMTDYNATHDDQAMWNPNIFAGMPGYMIEFGTRFPFLNDLRKVFDPVVNWRIFVLFLGAIGMYVLLVYLGFDAMVALMGAIGFALSCHFVGLIEIGHNTKFRSIMYIPWIFLSVHYLLHERDLFGVGLLSAFLISQFRESHPQIVYYTGLMLIVYWLVQLVGHLRSGEMRKFAGFTLLCVAAAVITGLAVAQPYLSIREYGEFTIRGEGGLPRDYAESWSFHPAEMVTFLIPGFFGGISPDYWGWMPATETSLYMGVVIFVLAIFSLFFENSRLKTFLIITSLLALFFSFGEHFPQLSGFLLKYLPYYNKFRVPATTLVLVEFAIIILAGIGIHGIMRKQDRHDDRFFRRIKGVTIGVVIMFVLFLLTKPVFAKMKLGTEEEYAKRVELSEMWEQVKPQVPQYEQYLMNFQQRKGGAITEADYKSDRFLDQARQVMELKQFMEKPRERLGRLMTDGIMMFVFTLLLLGLILLFGYHRMGKTVFVIMVLVLSTVDLVVANRWFLNDLVPAKSLEKPFAETDIDDFLLNDSMNKDEVFRILPLITFDQARGQYTPAFGNNRWAYHHQTLGGYHASKLKRYNDIIEKYLNGDNFQNILQGIDGGYWNIINMLNTKYVISPQPPSPAFHQVITSDRPRPVPAFENPGYLPRAWLVGDVRQLSKVEAVLDSIGDPRFDPARTAYVETAVPAVEIPDSGRTVVLMLSTDFDPAKRPANPREGLIFDRLKAPVGTDSTGMTIPAEIWPDPARPKKIGEGYDAHKIGYYVETNKPAFLVCSEVWYPAGWKATIDGKPTDIYATNYILRGIHVPAGRHYIEMRFEPEVYALSVTLSLIGIILSVLSLLIGGWLVWRRMHSGRIEFILKMGT